MQIDVLKNGYAAMEWPVGGANKKELDDEGNQKHRVYVSGPDGDCGYYDVVRNTFKSFPKSKIEFGLVDEEHKIVSVILKSGNTIYLGLLNSDDDDKDSETPAKENMIRAIENIEGMGEKITFEINLGPSKEVKINGRNHWIKANISVKVEEPKDIEKLYLNVSDLAESMLKLEEQRLWDSKY